LEQPGEHKSSGKEGEDEIREENVNEIIVHMEMRKFKN
jgi:hypothetical protein